MRRVDVWAAGDGYGGVVPAVTIGSAGGSGSGAAAVAVLDGAGDSVARVLISDGGADYMAHDTTVTIAAPTSGGTQAEATVVVARQGVRAVSVTDGGSGYAWAPSVSVSGVRAALHTTVSAEVGQTHDVVAAPASVEASLSADAVDAVSIVDAGEGYPLGSDLGRPRDVLAIITENHDAQSPIHSARDTTRWFKTPLASLARLRLSFRTATGALYPVQAGRAIVILDVYCEND